jgi:PAS domain S-box-containing protein
MTGRNHVESESHNAAESSERGAGISRADSVPPLRRDPLVWLLALLGVYVVGFAVWWLSGLGDASLARRLTGSAAIPGVVAVGVAVVRMRRSGRVDARTRLAWTIIALALVNYGIGSLLGFWAASGSTIGQIAPLATVMEMAAYPVAGIGLAFLPRPPRTSSDVILFWLDVAIVAWSAAMLLWHFVFYPTAQAAGADSLATMGAAAFPVADLAMVFALGAIALRGVRPGNRAALGAGAIALLLVFAGDTIAGIDALNRTYEPGGLAGLLYSGGWLGLASAAYLQWRIPNDEGQARGLADYARTFPWLPYAAVAVAFVAPPVRDWDSLDLLRQHIPATGALLALVVARLGFTARQSASLAAAERERLAAAVDQAAEAIMTTDHGVVSYVNPAFSVITGIPAASIVGRSPDLLRPKIESERLAQMSAALSRGDSWVGRLPLARPDGSVVEIDLAVSPLRDPSGAIAGSVAVARDRSRERALETELIQAQRMEAVGRLAGGIAHDFNNILTAISGFAQLAATELKPDDPAAADVDQIIKASDRAASLTRALLAFSRRQVMQPSPLDLNEILGGLAPMLERIIGEDIRLSVVPDPDLGVTMADRAQIEQVVLNLAVNARDAMPGGGRLTISTGNADLDAGFVRTHVGAKAGPHVKLTVSDTGTGMTPEVLEHAFEPFFTTKARGKGTGLGLSTVIGIVAQSGGCVGVESSPGQGSVFTICLPRVGEGGAVPEEAAAVQSRSAGGSETILVVEDEEAVRQFVVRVLGGAGYRVLVAANGAEALKIAASDPQLDLLFTDMVMPGMSGPDLALRFSSAHPGARTLFASGYSEEALDTEGPAEGATPYLAKPFTAEALLARVRLVLDAARDPSATA